LSQGVVCGVYFDPGLLYDVLQPGQPIEVRRTDGDAREGRCVQPNLILTDGTWIWPGALLYYVEEYHLQLPSTFLQYAERCQWRVDPASVQVEALNWDAFDEAPLAAG
jgi:hypothetical protein